MTPITREHIRNAYTYEEYRQMGEDLVMQGKTTGSEQTEDKIRFSKLNQHRMDRHDKNLLLEAETIAAVKAMGKAEIWLVLTEIWCGDAAHVLPVINAMALMGRKIRLCLLLRDENPEIMDAYLTDGTRSIPKLIRLDESLNELGTWGPRPEGAQKMMTDWKKDPVGEKMEVLAEIQKWYTADKTLSIQKELAALLTQ